jgi:protein SCO1/2
MFRYIVAFSIVIILSACGNRDSKKDSQNPKTSLPVLGKQTIPDFRFANQNGDTISRKTFENKIYVADFFFTTCPTICPVMKNEMLRVYETYKNEPRLLILSHTIDPEHDSVPVLKDFADRLEVTADKWHFVTGIKDSIYAMAERYMVSASEDKSAPGGFIHSGAFILIDENKRIRGYYDGTQTNDVDSLIQDIGTLLKEKK